MCCVGVSFNSLCDISSRYTGESSLVIRIDADTGNTDSRNSLLTADFTFVARDAKSNVAVRVPQLLVQGEGQQREWQIVRERVAQRKSRSDPALLDIRASFTSMAASLMEQGRLLTELPGPSKSGATLSVATALENTFVTQPQTRNMSGRVFGGFLMKRAFELAFSTAYMFSGCRLEFRLCVICLITSKLVLSDFSQACSAGNGGCLLSSTGGCRGHDQIEKSRYLYPMF